MSIKRRYTVLLRKDGEQFLGYIVSYLNLSDFLTHMKRTFHTVIIRGIKLTDSRDSWLFHNNVRIPYEYNDAELFLQKEKLDVC